MDFTVDKYRELLEELELSSYSFQTLSEYFKDPAEKVIILRHDVDDRNLHSLKFARLQYEAGIKGTYFFRIVPKSFDKKVIDEIQGMEHEIGYHYEDMDLADGDHLKAIELFEKHLSLMREVASIKTICMHGSPLSKYDNKDLWKYYNYENYNITGEPYFDLDFSKILYLTDTGRRWNGDKMSIRDRAGNATINKYMNENKISLSLHYSFKKTNQIIKALKKEELPDQIMLNFHPQRWTDNLILWTQELCLQNLKNVAKAGLRKVRIRN